MVKCIAWNQCRRVLCLPWPIKKSWGQCDSQRFLQSFHQRWIAWWNRPAQHCLCAFKGQCNVRNQSSRNFSVYRPQYFDWNPWTSTAGNVLGFWSIYWSWGLQKNHPQAAFCNSGKVLLADPNTEHQADLLCKVRPLVTLLQQKFSEAYTPGKNITVDEGLVKFNGRLSFKQYMPMKPDKFVIKVWLLTYANTYYVRRFQVYSGKNRTNSDLFRRKGLRYYVVWTLGEPYLDNNRHFFFDNFFTSADLMRDLQSRNTYACGTVRQNRKDFPANLMRMKLVAGEVIDFLKVRFCGSPVGRKTDFSHLQRAKFYQPDFRSALCPGVWQQLSPIRNRLIIWRHFPGNLLKWLPSITESKWMCEKPKTLG